MPKTLILYSTTDGHTEVICRRLQQVLENHGQRAMLLSMNDGITPNLDAFDQIVIGASIRYGRHNPRVIDFINQHRSQLERKRNAFFSVNAVARKPEKNRPETNPYLKKFLRKITWKPQRLAVFAGRIDYPKYSRLDRAMIRFIMWVTKGPTDPRRTFEFTDWAQVDAFSQSLLIK